jgi:hypothetical protein
MKNQILFVAILSVFSTAAFAQKNVPATLDMKDGSSIEIYHFGKLVCESNINAETYTTLRGKYSQSPTEINNYADIKKLVLEGFTQPPMKSAGNQKATITVIRKSGVKVTLVEAELEMSCYGSDDKFNQIKVQIINPLTDKAVEQTLDMKDIESVTFK